MWRTASAAERRYQDDLGRLAPVKQQFGGRLIKGASWFRVEAVDVLGAASAGVLNVGGTNGQIERNKVIATLADGIHNTERNLT